MKAGYLLSISKEVSKEVIGNRDIEKESGTDLNATDDRHDRKEHEWSFDTEGKLSNQLLSFELEGMPRPKSL